MKDLPKDYNLTLLEKYQAVTKDDVLDSLRKYFLPMFSSSSSTVVVVTTPSKVDQIANDLEEYGFKTEKRTLEAGAEDNESSIGDSEISSEASQ